MRPEIQDGETVCSLCQQSAELSESHIITDYFIRSLQEDVPMGRTGKTHPASTVVSTVEGIAGGQKQRGLWETQLGMVQPLLCRSCEARFNQYETYFRNTFYESKNKRLKKRDIGHRTTATAVPLAGEVTETREIKADFKKFRLFVLSLLWRADVVKGKFFDEVSLGPIHRERLRKILHDEVPATAEAYPIVTVNLGSIDGATTNCIQKPRCLREGGLRFYAMTLGGFLFLIYVNSEGHPLPSQVLNVSQQQTGTMIVATADGEALIRQIERMSRLSL